MKPHLEQRALRMRLRLAHERAAEIGRDRDPERRRAKLRAHWERVYQDKVAWQQGGQRSK